MTILSVQATRILEAARDAGVGIIIKVPDTMRAIANLNRVITASTDPTLKSLTLRRDPNHPLTHLWIINRAAGLEGMDAALKLPPLDATTLTVEDL